MHNYVFQDRLLAFLKWQTRRSEGSHGQLDEGGGYPDPGEVMCGECHTAPAVREAGGYARYASAGALSSCDWRLSARMPRRLMRVLLALDGAARDNTMSRDDSGESG